MILAIGPARDKGVGAVLGPKNRAGGHNQNKVIGVTVAPTPLTSLLVALPTCTSRAVYDLPLSPIQPDFFPRLAMLGVERG